MLMTLKKKRDSGFTLAEVMIGSLVFAVLGWGIISSYVAISKMLQQQESTDYAEATNYAVQTMERFRNMIACDPNPIALNAEWYDENCQPTGNIPTVWTVDPLPATAGTESILLQGDGAMRLYCVVQTDCNGAGVVGDCNKMSVQLCYDDLTTCNGLIGNPCV